MIRASDTVPGSGTSPVGRLQLSRLLIAAGLIILLLETAQAAEWRFRPRVGVAGTYSDNINISGTNPQTDFVTDLNAGFSLRGEGPRFFFDTFYNLQYLNYARETSSDRFRNQLRVVGNGEIAEDLFFLDLRGSVRQENITSRANTADSTITVSDNITDTYTLGISPYLIHRFGSFMDGEARYSYDKVVYSDDRRADSQANAILLDLKSGNRFQTVTWNAFYRGYDEKTDIRDVLTSHRGEVAGRYHFNRKAALVFGTGYEDNDFVTNKTDSLSAVTWLAGLSWTPNLRTVVEAGAQNRFFGVAPYFNLRYLSRRTALTVRYFEDLTTTNQSTANRDFIPLLDAFGDPVLDPDTGEAISIPINTLSSTVDLVVVNQTFDATVAVRGQRTDVGLTLFDQFRNFQVGPDEEVYGITAFANRRLSRVTTLRLWARASRHDFDGPTPDRTRWSVGIGLNRAFSRDFSGSISARHTTQDSKAANLDYDENRVTLSLTKHF